MSHKVYRDIGPFPSCSTDAFFTISEEIRFSPNGWKFYLGMQAYS